MQAIEAPIEILSIIMDVMARAWNVDLESAQFCCAVILSTLQLSIPRSTEYRDRSPDDQQSLMI